MVEPDPVPDLVSRGAPQVEGLHGASRKGGVEKNDSVVLGVAFEVVGEGSVTEELTASETDGVDVQCAGGSPSESVLHLGLLGGGSAGLVEPDGILGPGDPLQRESEAGSAIVLIQDVDLVPHLFITEIGDRS